MDGFKLSNIIEIVERTVYSRLLEACVENGYTPDISDSLVFPNSPEGQVAYIEKLREIRSEKGFAIEIFNDSGIADKGDKEVPRIVIIPEGFEEGDIGHGFEVSKIFDQTTKTFIPYKIPSKTSDYYFRVVVVGNKTTHFRTLTSLIALGLPIIGYINPINDLSTIHPYIRSSPKLFIQRTQTFELDDLRAGVFERSSRYVVKDLFEIEPDILTSITPIDSIMVNFYVSGKSARVLNINFETKMLASEVDVLASDDANLTDI